MAKPNINNYEDLMEEKARLKANVQRAKANIKQSFEALKEELNPFSAIKETAMAATAPGTTNPIVKFGIKRATEFLMGKVLLKRAGWLPRLVVPFLTREIITRIIGVKADKKIASSLRTAADKIRETDLPDLSRQESTTPQTV